MHGISRKIKGIYSESNKIEYEEAVQKAKSDREHVHRVAKKTASTIIKKAEKILEAYLNGEYKRSPSDTKKSFSAIQVHTFYFYEFKNEHEDIIFNIFKKYFKERGVSASLKRFLSQEGDLSVGIKNSYYHEVWLSW